MSKVREKINNAGEVRDESAPRLIFDDTSGMARGAGLKKGASSNAIDFSARRHTIEQNRRIWDEEYGWECDGDEWNGQARHCSQDYADWKRSLIEAFILPYLSPESIVLEIAAGRGRWSRELVDRCGELILLDLSPSCIHHCKELFAARENVHYIINDGKTLPGVISDSIDFIWSFDSFVHMNGDVIDSYLGECYRVLKPGGIAVIHHPGRYDAALRFSFLRGGGKNALRLYKLLSLGRVRQDDGWRSDVSADMVSMMALMHGLTVEGQHRRWGAAGQFSVERYNDYITVMQKPLLD